MDIRYKLYPYPVLSNYSDDYINSSFDSAIEVKREGYNIVISVVSEIKNPELEALIKEGKAAFVYHLECAQTGYRTVISTANTDKLVSISEDKVCGRLQICPFIVACADIPDYVNSCFNEDYRGYKFQIEAGCVMAVGKQVNCDIDKERNDLVSAKSFVARSNSKPARIIKLVFSFGLMIPGKPITFRTSLQPLLSHVFSASYPGEYSPAPVYKHTTESNDDLNK